MKKIFLITLSAVLLLPQTGRAQLIPFAFWNKSTVIQRGSGVTTVQGSASSVVLSAPANVQLNDVLYAFIWVDYYSTLGTVSTPTGWTQLGYTTLSNQYAFYAFRRISTGTDGSSYTFSFSSSANYSMGAIIAYYNVNLSTPEDVSVVFSQGSVSSNTVSVTGLTTISPYDQILMAVVDTSDADSLVAPTGFSQKWLNIDTADSQTIAGYDQLLVSPGATGTISTSGWTVSGNNYQIALLAIKPKVP